jgi:hypothetical protein
MNDQTIKIVTAIMNGIGVLLLLAAGFDLVPAQDNLVVFLGIACFIVAGVFRKVAKK